MFKEKSFGDFVNTWNTAGTVGDIMTDNLSGVLCVSARLAPFTKNRFTPEVLTSYHGTMYPVSDVESNERMASLV
jgi:hypothetical protein